jgi:predicted cupin superfamily sugar epimerase
MTPIDASALIRSLALSPHPEGGWYREIFRSAEQVTHQDGRVRPTSTAIYYLLEAGRFSAWHRVSSDEIWHYYGGAPVLLHQLGQPTLTLDADHPVGIVKAGAWQATETTAGATLCGCTVAPGFDFADFEFGTADQLLAAFPDEVDVIRRLVKR